MPKGIYLRKSKTHCKFGHAFSEQNTYVDSRGSKTCKICRRKREFEYRKENREILRKRVTNWREEHQREWQENNREKTRIHTYTWKKRNPEKVRQQRYRRRFAELNQLGNFSNWMLPYYRYSQDSCCFYCNKKINPNLSAGEPSREILEHLIPLCREGLHCWTNTALACWRCNSRKGTKTIEEFMEDIRK